MFHKNRKPKDTRLEGRQQLDLQSRFKSIHSPLEATQLLNEAVNLFRNGDKHTLEHFILDLRQEAEDIQFKYYKARCRYIIIPPEDSLSFWVSYVLGSLPETSRFSSFEGEVLELLKLISPITLRESEKDLTINQYSIPGHEVEAVLSLFKEKHPIFFSAVTQKPVLIPILNFSIPQGAVVSIPRLHCIGLFKPKNEEHPLVAVLHSFAHILHYQLTEDLSVLPPGFINLHYKLFDEYEMTYTDWAETFAESVVSSLLYETEYMPLVAYMELSSNDHMEIHNYLTWLEIIYASSLQDNLQRLIQKCESRLRA